jgi:hypothetical protein
MLTHSVLDVLDLLIDPDPNPNPKAEVSAREAQDARSVADVSSTATILQDSNVVIYTRDERVVHDEAIVVVALYASVLILTEVSVPISLGEGTYPDVLDAMTYLVGPNTMGVVIASFSLDRTTFSSLLDKAIYSSLLVAADHLYVLRLAIDSCSSMISPDYLACQNHLEAILLPPHLPLAVLSSFPVLHGRPLHHHVD